jgi:DNA polymerase-3 subunit gamma/tau
VKDLSLKLFEWTEQRWIITFSKNKGEISVKEKKENKKIEILIQAKDTELFKKVLEKFSDANLINVTEKDDQEK